MVTRTPMEEYISLMSEPVTSRRQPANILFFTQDNLSEAQRLIELTDLKTHVHIDDQGVAAVYLYIDSDLGDTVRDLSTIGTHRPEYYQHAAEILGIDQGAVDEWITHHRLDVP